MTLYREASYDIDTLRAISPTKSSRGAWMENPGIVTAGPGNPGFSVSNVDPSNPRLVDEILRGELLP